MTSVSLILLTSEVAITRLGVGELKKVITDRGDKPTGNKAGKAKVLKTLVAQEYGDHKPNGTLSDERQIHKLTVPVIRAKNR
jgi:hypothetical protein